MSHCSKSARIRSSRISTRLQHDHRFGGYLLDNLSDHLVQDLRPPLVFLIRGIDQNNNRALVSRLKSRAQRYASMSLTVARSSYRSVATLRMINPTQSRSFSTKTAWLAPRLRASRPSAPVPAKTSNHRTIDHKVTQNIKHRFANHVARRPGARPTPWARRSCGPCVGPR